MVFSSLTFLFLFLPALYLLYFLFPMPRWRNGVLIVMSLLFYGWGEPVWILAMLFSTGVNYLCGIFLARARSGAARKLILAVGVFASVVFLLYFKYSAFAVNSLFALLGVKRRMAFTGAREPRRVSQRPAAGGLPRLAADGRGEGHLLRRGRKPGFSNPI